MSEVENRTDQLRGRLDKVLETLVDDETIRLVISTALEAKKQARGWCPECKHAVMVEIDDSKAAISAIETLANQAKGRPDVAAGVDDEQIVFERELILGCKTCECDGCRKSRGETDAPDSS